MKKKKLIITIIIIITALIGLFAWQAWEKSNIVITEFSYKNSNIPDAFNGYRIVQISDLHNRKFGKNQSKLIDKVRECNPDIIVITGDLISDANDDISIAMQLINGVEALAPVYYVTGNHEKKSGKYVEIKQRLVDAKVTVLDNERATITKNGEEITVIGLHDPSFYRSSLEENLQKTDEALEGLSSGDGFKVLLSHRPELIDMYVENKIDIAFTGHTHGGQIRLPFIGAIFAPNQGLFPKYAKGMYLKEDTTMIVSGGLGNPRIPVRVMNRPEVVVVELQR